MLHLSTEELCVISILLEKEEESIQNSEKRKRKRFSVYKMLNSLTGARGI
jgi:predicted transcriptional regulator